MCTKCRVLTTTDLQRPPRAARAAPHAPLTSSHSAPASPPHSEHHHLPGEPPERPLSAAGSARLCPLTAAVCTRLPVPPASPARRPPPASVSPHRCMAPPPATPAAGRLRPGREGPAGLSRHRRLARLLQGSLSLPGSPFNIRRGSRGSHQLTWRAANGRKLGDRKPLVLSTYMDAQEHLPYADDSAAVTPMSEENGTMVLPVYQQQPSGLLAGSRHGSYTSHGSRRSYNSHGDLLNGRGLTKESQLRSRRAPPADAAELQQDCVSTAVSGAPHDQLSRRRAWACRRRGRCPHLFLSTVVTDLFRLCLFVLPSRLTAHCSLDLPEPASACFPTCDPWLWTCSACS